ncbi:MAG TPA: GNAT family N-acetyltransferase [Caldilineaceae bacterium]|nr:GNAT family N-acetyltransferase [Caldilineaceae bacterium]
MDDIDQPRRCLLTCNVINFAFCGGAPDQLWLDQAVAELCQSQELYLSWPPPVADFLHPPGPADAAIDIFEFYDRHSTPAPPLPNDHQLCAIDADLLTRCLWGRAMIQGFGSTDNFLRYGIGLCLMKNEEICCEAYATFLGAGKFEIGAITHEQYRQHGYAYLTCQYLIQQCETRGYPTYWSCYQTNVASVATARKLGYRVQKPCVYLHYRQLIQSRVKPVMTE